MKCLCLFPYPRKTNKKSRVKEFSDKILLKLKIREEGWSLGKLVLAKEVGASLSVGANILKRRLVPSGSVGVDQLKRRLVPSGSVGVDQLK